MHNGDVKRLHVREWEKFSNEFEYVNTCISKQEQCKCDLNFLSADEYDIINKISKCNSSDGFAM